MIGSLWFKDMTRPERARARARPERGRGRARRRHRGSHDRASARTPGRARGRARGTPRGGRRQWLQHRQAELAARPHLRQARRQPRIGRGAGHTAPRTRPGSRACSSLRASSASTATYSASRTTPTPSRSPTSIRCARRRRLRSRLGLPASYVEDVDLPFAVAGAVRFDEQAEFHPVKYLEGLAAALEGPLYEGTMATHVHGGRVRTAGGQAVSAEHVVVATHLPFLDRGLYFARCHPERSYVVAGRTTRRARRHVPLHRAAGPLDQGARRLAARGRREPQDGAGRRGGALRAPGGVGARALRDRARAALGDPGPDAGGRRALRGAPRPALVGRLGSDRLPQVGPCDGHGRGGAAGRPDRRTRSSLDGPVRPAAGQATGRARPPS